MKKIAFLCLVSVAAVLSTGCETARVLIRPAQTNTVEVLQTNKVENVRQADVISTALNPIPGLPEIVTTNRVTVTNYVDEVLAVSVPVVLPPVYYDEKRLAPGVAAAIELGGAAAPVPWGSAAGSIATALAGVGFGIVNFFGRKKALGERAKFQEVAGVLVDSVEDVRKAALTLPEYRAIDGHVVKALEVAQAAAGRDVKREIEQLVAERTNFTTDKPLVA